jgi:hypothetical protein
MLQNISGARTATWQQKMAADFPSLYGRQQKGFIAVGAVFIFSTPFTFETSVRNNLPDHY